MPKIKNLVFKGGGVLGITYAGAIKALEDAEIMEGVEGAAGTSVGALVAALVCMKYSAKEIEEVMRKTDFTKFLDSPNPINIPKSYGLYSGDFLFEWIQELVENKCEQKELTFREFRDKGFKDLRVVATDLSNADIKVFSAEKTPDTDVAESIRASMSIPMIFKAWKFSNGKPDEHIYVDGGVVSNYPVGAFDNKKHTLGLFIDTHIADDKLDYDNISQYAKFLFKAVLRGQDVDYFRNEEKEKMTVHIKNMGFSSIDFDLSEDDQEKLYNSGLKCTKEYLSNDSNSSSWKDWFK